jgi:hypothetical protein
MKSYYKIELARKYNISYSTFKKWMKSIGLQLNKKKRLLTPMEVTYIFEKLGNPN